MALCFFCETRNANVPCHAEYCKYVCADRGTCKTIPLYGVKALR